MRLLLPASPFLCLGDAAVLLPELPDDSIDLVFTSPPYALRRKRTSGGIAAGQYVEWFMPLSHQLQRILKPTGTFILHIKEHAEDGVRHPYVIELILALADSGWLWTEEFVWHKKDAYSGKWPNRFRDAWERL